MSTILPLDCISVVMSFSELTEVLMTQALVCRQWKVASDLESTWSELLQTSHIEGFLHLQHYLASHMPRETMNKSLELFRQLESYVLSEKSRFLRMRKILALVQAPKYVDFSDFATMVTITCRLVETFRTGRLGIPDSENRFFNPKAQRPSFAGQKRGRTSPQSFISPDEQRRRLIHITKYTLRPGALCDPLSVARAGLQALVDHNVPSPLIALFCCIGGQDIDVLGHYDPQLAVSEEEELSSVPENFENPQIPPDGVDAFECAVDQQPYPQSVRARFSGLFGSHRFYDHWHNTFMLSPIHAVAAFLEQKNAVDTALLPIRQANMQVAGRTYHLPLEKLFPFAVSESGGRLGVALEDIVLRSPTNVDPLEEGQEGSEDLNPEQVYPRGTVLYFAVSPNPNNAFVVAPSVSAYLRRFVEGVTGVECRGPMSIARTPSRTGDDLYNPLNLRQRFEISPLTGAITTNPMYGLYTSTEQTEGVEVIMSPVFLFDQSRKNVRYNYTYQCTMRFVGSTAVNPGVTCQLKSRHWEIKHYQKRSAKEGPQCVVDNVEGDGVIGEQPILQRQGTARGDGVPSVYRFQYSSCVEFRSTRGEMGGYFTFVPGTIQNPIGKPFKVVVAPFTCAYDERKLKDSNSVLWRDFSSRPKPRA